MRRLVGALVVIALLLCLAPVGMAQSAAPNGQMTWAVHFTLAPRWLDPAEAEGSITPFLTLYAYAVHDALLKPMPSGASAPSLAESWTVSPNDPVYDFTLRANARFHNGERVTAEDVKFSRLAIVAVKGGPYTAGVLPEVQDLFERQARERDRKKREEMLHQIQRILFEKKIFAPIWENGFIRGVGPRVEEPALSLIPAFPYSAPYEDVRLKP
jgi:ABC-type transport system substrate-binding protein